MKIGIIVNDVKTELAGYTTTRLAISASKMGHTVAVFGNGDLSYNPDGSISAFAKTVKKTSTAGSYIKDLNTNTLHKVKLSEFDAVILRSDPADDIKRPWAKYSGISFGKLLSDEGVTVLNDPDGLARASNKMYFQTYPESIRPYTLISRDAEELKHFASEFNSKIVLKPLQGSGGQNVFLVNEKEKANLNQMIEAISRDGYVIAQEYLPKASEGDIRLFMMNGKPLKYKGKYAAFCRLHKEGDIRSNVHAGGKIVQAKITDKILELADIVTPKLIKDGMFLAGLDIVDNKLMEINVFSPGGLGSAQKFEGVDFAKAVIIAIEKKIRYKKFYDKKLDNLLMATIE
jgi:glutathione synthase